MPLADKVATAQIRLSQLNLGFRERCFLPDRNISDLKGFHETSAFLSVLYNKDKPDHEDEEREDEQHDARDYAEHGFFPTGAAVGHRNQGGRNDRDCKAQ